MKFKTAILTIAACCLLCSCCKSIDKQGALEVKISRCLEQVIELGEKYVSEDDLIRDIALAEGSDKAMEVYEGLNHRADREAFWSKLMEADSLARQITDTLEQQAVISHMMPYIERIQTLIEMIQP